MKVPPPHWFRFEPGYAFPGQLNRLAEEASAGDGGSVGAFALMGALRPDVNLAAALLPAEKDAAGNNSAEDLAKKIVAALEACTGHAARPEVAWAASLKTALRAHVEQHADAPRQGSDAWLKAKESFVGGSELGALFGSNPYMTRNALVGRKAGLKAGSSTGVACSWGTLFEPTSERLLELQCGTEIFGTDIHVQNPDLVAGHANSPDGYCVLALAAGEITPPETPGAVHHATVVELKAPYSRLPDGRVPRQYRSQIQSGIAFCPPASLGLYLEVVYRLCTLVQFADGTRSFCQNYHAKDGRKGLWEVGEPEGCGAFAVYAPRVGGLPGEERTVARRDAEGFATEVYSAALGVSPALAGAPGQAEAADLSELADRGRAGAALFDRVVGYAASGVFPISRPDPVVGGGNAAALLAAPPPPPGHYLLGFICWKVQQSDYHLIPPEPDFLELTRREVGKFWDDVAKVREAPDPVAALGELGTQKGGASTPPRPVSPSLVASVFEVA